MCQLCDILSIPPGDVHGLAKETNVPETKVLQKMLDAKLRHEALVLAIDSVKMDNEKSSGQVIIRRAVGFYKFLDGRIDSRTEVPEDA